MIGLGLISGRFLRATLFLLAVQMVGTLVPLILYPSETFTRFPYAPTLEGQYIIKNVVLIGAAMVVGSTVRGGRIVPGRGGRRDRGVGGVEPSRPHPGEPRNPPPRQAERRSSTAARASASDRSRPALAASIRSRTGKAAPVNQTSQAWRARSM